MSREQEAELDESRSGCSRTIAPAALAILRPHLSTALRLEPRQTMGTLLGRMCEQKRSRRLEGRDRRFSHFMGAVVLETRGGFPRSVFHLPRLLTVNNGSRPSRFSSRAVRDFATAKGFGATAETIENYLLNDKPQQMEEPSVEVYKVWPTEADRTMFIDILTLGREKLRAEYPEHFYKTRDKIYDYRTTPRLIAAYDFLRPS